MIRSLNVAIVLYVLKCIDRTLYLLSTAVSHRSSLRQRWHTLGVGVHLLQRREEPWRCTGSHLRLAPALLARQES